MQKVGIGVIGCGGRVHGVLKRIPGLGADLEIRALHDVSPKSIEKAQEGIAPNAKIYDDYRQLVPDPELDWIFVGSWNCYHKEHAVAALQAGKNVFCEKPLATTLEDCLAIREAWEASGKIFSLGFVLRYSPHYQTIRETVQSGQLGRIVSMEFNETLHFEHGGFIHGDWRRLKRFAGSHLLEKCCHDIDLVHWIVDSLPTRVASFGGLNFFKPENESFIAKLGPHPSGRPAFSSWSRPKAASSFTKDKDIIDNQVAILEFANGTRATFHTNCSTNRPERRMYICGTEGTLRADVLRGEIEFIRIGHEEKVQRLDAGAKGGHGNGDSVLSDSLRRSMLEGAPPLASVNDGVQSAVTVFGIDQAMASGQVVDMRSLWDKAGIPLGEEKTCIVSA